MSGPSRPVSDPEASRAAERYMADREGRRARIAGPSDEERLHAEQGRHREELTVMDRSARRAGRSR